MSLGLDALLQRLAADSTRLSSLTAVQERALREHLEAALGDGGAVVPITTSAATPPSGLAWGPDDLLTVEEAAAALRVSPRWLYRHAKQLPFARKLSPKVLRFSRSGMARWMATKRP